METTRNLKHKYGVFVYTNADGGWYQSSDAIAWFVRESAAQKWVDKHDSNMNKNLVVRSLEVIKGN